MYTCYLLAFARIVTLSMYGMATIFTHSWKKKKKKKFSLRKQYKQIILKYKYISKIKKKNYKYCVYLEGLVPSRKIYKFARKKLCILSYTAYLKHNILFSKFTLVTFLLNLNFDKITKLLFEIMTLLNRVIF